MDTVVLTYGVLFMDWGREDTPFRGVSLKYFKYVELKS
jgi:hypothetical protein